ncbi:hypothetical protein [Deinococcus apachensis]|uniref:hypothetical protein n=1 Tax=Deinococcus apachensis TaxID=309886 RepID=UPI00037DA843|nr:hypothetical protein [Deinococcus apachensis]
MKQDINPEHREPRPRIYVLRVWHEESREGSVWRASAREGTQGERRYFTSADDLLEFMYTECLRP